jgi:hypothetical protein
MSIPDGGGTEVLKNLYKDGLNNAWWSGTDVTVPASHIWTILSITMSNISSDTADIGLRIVPSAGGSLDIIPNTGDTPLTRYGVFVWNDKLVLSAGDEIRFYTNKTMDIFISYIDQDWSA